MLEKDNELEQGTFALLGMRINWFGYAGFQ